MYLTIYIKYVHCSSVSLLDLIAIFPYNKFEFLTPIDKSCGSLKELIFDIFIF